MKIKAIETTVLEMPYTKPLVTATNNFTVARGVLVKVVTDATFQDTGMRIFFHVRGKPRSRPFTPSTF